MKRMVTIVAALAVLGMSALASASPVNIFLSTSNTDPAVTNPSLNLNVGDSATLYIWANMDTTVDQEINGLSLNVSAATSGIVSATSSQEYNPVSFNNGRSDVLRWDGVGNGTLNSGGLLVSNMEGAALNAAGIDGMFSETGGDYQAGGNFLIGELSLTAVQAGSTDLFLQVGQGGISDTTGTATAVSILFGADETNSLYGNAFGTDSSVADGSVTVAAAVPEPASLALLALGGLFVLPRRRRQA